MRRLPLVLSFAAVASVGCATNSTARPDVSSFSVASLAEPVEVEAASGWSEIQPLTAAAPSTQNEWTKRHQSGSSHGDLHLTLMAGERWLDDDWEPLDEPAAFGLEIDGSDPATGNGYEVGVLYTNDDDDLFTVPLFGTVEGETTTYEIYGGFRHTFNPGASGLHPFVSAGIDVEHGELELSATGVSEDDDDTIFGAYARAGLLWDISERLRLGLDYRHLFAQDFEVFDTDFDGDYDQVMLTLGWAF